MGAEDKTLNLKEASFSRSRRDSKRGTPLSTSIEFKVAEL